jgi:hypothetical protein
MIGMKEKPGRGSHRSLDPEFFGVVSGKPDPSARSRRTLGYLIYAHCVAAALTASFRIEYGFRYLWTGEVRFHGPSLEGISILAFLTVFLLPPVVLAAPLWGRITKEEHWCAILATLALALFQFLAIFPSCQ